MTNETEEKKNTLDGKGPESTTGSKSEGHFLDLDEAMKSIAELEGNVETKKASSETQALRGVENVSQLGGTSEDIVVAQAAREILNTKTGEAGTKMVAVSEKEKTDLEKYHEGWERVWGKKKGEEVPNLKIVGGNSGLTKDALEFLKKDWSNQDLSGVDSVTKKIAEDNGIQVHSYTTMNSVIDQLRTIQNSTNPKSQDMASVEKQATADDWQDEAVKNFRASRPEDSDPGYSLVEETMTEGAAVVKEFEDAAFSNKSGTATSVEEDENKKFELSPEAKLNLTPEQQELVKKIEDNIANAEGEIKTRVEKTGMSLDPIRRVGEAYNKFPRSFKYLLAGSLVASGIGAGIMGAAFLAGTAGTVGVAMRVLGGAGLFVTIEKVLKGAEERKTGAPRSKAAELRHTAEAATFAVALGAVLPNLLHGALSGMHVPQGVLDTIIKYDPTGTLAQAPAPTGASVYQTPFKSPLSSAAVLDKMHTMTPPHAAPALDIATPPRVVSAEEFLNQKIRHDISVPPIDLINEGFVPHEIPQDVPLKDVLMEGYTAPANEQMVSTPHGAEIATPKVEVKNIITGTEKGEGYVVEKTGSSVELTGFTGEEVLNKGWRMNIHPSGAGLDFDRSMVTMTGRDISGQIAVYKDLLGAGKTEEAAHHLTALHKAVELAEKSMGTGIIDHSKIPGMELNPNDVDMP